MSYGYHCEKCNTVVIGLRTCAAHCLKCGAKVLSRRMDSQPDDKAVANLRNHRYHVPCGGGCGFIINCTPPLSRLGKPWIAECYELCCDCCRARNGDKCKIQTNSLIAIA